MTLSAAEIYCERIRCLLNVNADNLSVHGDRLRGIVLQVTAPFPSPLSYYLRLLHWDSHSIAVGAV